jgi:hydroxypyruvate isomerase
MTRRSILSASAALAVAGRPAPADETAPQKGRIKQSACRWCYQKISLDDLCRAGAEMGLSAIDLVSPDEAATLKKYGLIPSMIIPGGGDIPDAFNRKENHDKLEAELRERIPKAAAVGAPNIITFSGNRRGMSDREGLENTVLGLNRVKKIGEDHGVTICLELLNSKVDHHDYMCDHTAWGVEVIKRVDSPRVRLLYDIYHMQIMEGDIIRTIRDNIDSIAHFHTGGVPGRHELDDTQELQWRTVAKAIADLNFAGYMAHEFVPVHDPLTSLHQAVQLCTV